MKRFVIARLVNLIRIKKPMYRLLSSLYPGFLLVFKKEVVNVLAADSIKMLCHAIRKFTLMLLLKSYDFGCTVYVQRHMVTTVLRTRLEISVLL